VEFLKGMSGVWESFGRQEALGAEHDLSLGGVWDAPRLDVAAETLARLPAEHVAPLEHLELGGTSAWGEHLGDTIWLSAEARALGASEKHGGDTSALAGHLDPVRQLEMTLAHEVGHEAEEQHPEAAAKIYQAAGWRSGLGMGQLAGAGLTREDLLAIVNGDELAVDGQRYQRDADAMQAEAARRQEKGVSVAGLPPQFMSYAEDFVPEGGAHNGGSDADSWIYARSEPSEYFAELYTKAVNLPELLHADLVSEPSAEIDAALMAEAALRDGGARPGELAAATQEILRLRQAATRKRTQWDVMRGEVFGVDDALIEDRVADLESMGGFQSGRQMDATIAAFREAAARVATPAQLEQLYEGYLE
jgi:hypothetical protein